MKSPVASIIDRWPSLGTFASDAGVSYGAAKQMRRRGSIPIEYWPAIIESEAGRQLGLTADELMRVHSREAPAPTADTQEGHAA